MESGNKVARHKQIQFGSTTIDYTLTFRDRKTLGITVTPEMEVKVVAPLDASLEKVEEKVKKRAPWILKQRSYFLNFHPKSPPKKFISGETHLYLGRQYRLKVMISEQNSVKLNGKFLLVECTQKELAEELLRAWYANKANKKFRVFADPLIERFKKYGVEPSQLVLRNMPSRWGSCTPKGKIILNPELIRAPRACIEYVIIHELCHLIHHDHTQKFLDLQHIEMPDWEKWKEKLELMLS